MKVLKFLGSIVYGAIVYYLIWLFFYWITPYMMGLSWLGYAAYMAGGIFVLISMASTLGILTHAPLMWLIKGCKPAKYPPMIFAAFFGFSSVKLPWSLDMEYGFLQWVLAISLTLFILLTFAGLIKITFDTDGYLD